MANLWVESLLLLSLNTFHFPLSTTYSQVENNKNHFGILRSFNTTEFPSNWGIPAATSRDIRFPCTSLMDDQLCSKNSVRSHFLKKEFSLRQILRARALLKRILLEILFLISREFYLFFKGSFLKFFRCSIKLDNSSGLR